VSERIQTGGKQITPMGELTGGGLGGQENAIEVAEFTQSGSLKLE
jgi:hypothetical protein